MWRISMKTTHSTDRALHSTLKAHSAERNVCLKCASNVPQMQMNLDWNLAFYRQSAMLYHKRRAHLDWSLCSTKRALHSTKRAPYSAKRALHSISQKRMSTWGDREKRADLDTDLFSTKKKDIFCQRSFTFCQTRMSTWGASEWRSNLAP